MLQAIIVFFGAGTIKPNFNIHDVVAAQAARSALTLTVRQTELVIAFVDQFPMLTTKQLDYICWKQLYNVRLVGGHLTSQGLCEIKLIRSGMNSKRSK